MGNFEISTHFFLNCLFALNFWNWLGEQLNRTIDTTSILSTLSCVPSSGSSQVRDLFISGIIHTFHTIWLVRNSLCFNGLKASHLAAKAKISTLVMMSGHASNGHCFPTTVDIRLLDRFQILPSFRRFKDIEMIVWKSPSPPLIKVKTNGSLRLSNAACGGIFRDKSGVYMGAFSANIGVVLV